MPITGTLAYLSNQDAWVIRGSSFQVRRLTNLGDLDGRVFALSPDGAYLLFTRLPGAAISPVEESGGTGAVEITATVTVTATISARVVNVTMEGNLVIQGYRETRVNNETQFIILSGLVRPRDISANNSIKSTHIANARIEYSGTGVISDKQQPGWLAQTVDIIWPF